MDIDLTGLAINRSLNESIDIVYNLNHNELVHLTGEPLRLSPAGDYVVMCLFLINMGQKKKPSIKFVRKKRIYIKRRNSLFPFFWIEFLKDGSFSLGLISKEIEFTEYGSAIQKSVSFKNHVQTLRRGNISLKETKAPHYTFHPPRIIQEAGVVHMLDTNGIVDEWELDWFPVRKTQHLLTLNSGQIHALGTVNSTKKNISIVTVPQEWGSLRMDMFICPVGANIKLDPSAIDNVIGGCKYYNLICSFYKDCNDSLCFYVSSEM